MGNEDGGNSMLWIRTGALRGLRWGILGVASVALLALSNNSSLAAPYADIVLDANSGKVLHSTNPDAKRHPASLTKIMTLYLLFEQLEAGQMKLDEKMDVSEEAAGQSPTKLGLHAGDTISVEDAIKGLVTRSANDAAVVIAEWIGDDEESFAEMMTKKAKALGMTRTVYKNASGLPDDEQVTTARDQAILGRAIQEHFPRYYKFFSTRSFRYHGRSIRNHNSLLGRVDGVDGIKTGYIRASGFNLVTSIHRGNRYVVAVVMGGNSARSRDARMRQLISDNLGTAGTKRTVAMIPRPPMEPEAAADSETETKVAETTEAKPETKAATADKPKPEPKVVAVPEPRPAPKVAVNPEVQLRVKGPASLCRRERGLDLGARGATVGTVRDRRHRSYSSGPRQDGDGQVGRAGTHRGACSAQCLHRACTSGATGARAGPRRQGRRASARSPVWGPRRIAEAKSRSGRGRASGGKREA